MNKILIVDDEKLARDRIKRFLKSFNSEFIVTEAENGLQALQQIKESTPDIVFLDIQMPVMNGFDVLYQLTEIKFQIIFQTAFDEYAVKAFEVNACDYLLKPFAEEKLHKALTKALTKVISQDSQFKKNQDLESDLIKKDYFLKTLVVKKAAEFIIIKIDDIIYFKSEDHYTFAFTANAEYILDLSLNHLEEKLNIAEFFRAHRNSLVRLSEISKLNSAEDSTLVLKNQIILDISRNSRKKLLTLL